MDKNRCGKRVHDFRIFVEDKLIDHLDSVEFECTNNEDAAAVSYTTEDGDRVWSF